MTRKEAEATLRAVCRRLVEWEPRVPSVELSTNDVSELREQTAIIFAGELGFDEETAILKLDVAAMTPPERAS